MSLPKPSFQGYRWVEQLAGKDWSKVKQNLRQTLHRYREWGAEDVIPFGLIVATFQ